MKRPAPAHAALCWITLIICLSSCSRMCSGQQRHRLLRRLKRAYPDFEPAVVLDIGANEGKYAKAIREVFPKSKILMFEASSVHNSSLQNFAAMDGNAESYIGVLSGTDGDKVSFYNYGGSTGNSMFRENTKNFVNLKPIEKITSKVDTIVASSPLAKNAIVDMIKADVQGAELLVFAGATRALEEATFVQFEGSTVEFNEGGACFHEVDEFLRSFGFHLYEIGDFLYNPVFKTKGMGQFDVIYVKPSSPRLPAYLKENKPKYCGAGRKSDFDVSSFALGAAEQRRLQSSQEKKLGGTDWYVGFLSGVVLTLFSNILRGRRAKFVVRNSQQQYVTL